MQFIFLNAEHQDFEFEAKSMYAYAFTNLRYGSNLYFCVEEKN